MGCLIWTLLSANDLQDLQLVLSTGYPLERDCLGADFLPCMLSNMVPLKQYIVPPMNYANHVSLVNELHLLQLSQVRIFRKYLGIRSMSACQDDCNSILYIDKTESKDMSVPFERDACLK